jgi:hypothetical protein
MWAISLSRVHRAAMGGQRAARRERGVAPFARMSTTMHRQVARPLEPLSTDAMRERSVARVDARMSPEVTRAVERHRALAAAMRAPVAGRRRLLVVVGLVVVVVWRRAAHVLYFTTIKGAGGGRGAGHYLPRE